MRESLVSNEESEVIKNITSLHAATFGHPLASFFKRSWGTANKDELSESTSHLMGMWIYM